MAEAPSSKRLAHSLIGAPQRGHSPRKHCPQAVSRILPAQISFATYIGTEKALRYLGEPFLYVLELAKLNLDGIAAMRSGGSVLKALSAAEGALPREYCPRAGHAKLCHEHHPQVCCAELYREREPVRRYW